MKLTIFFFFLFAITLALSVGADDAAARAKCEELMKRRIGLASAYANDQCLLSCITYLDDAVIGHTVLHQMNEGLPCPLAPTGICRNGQCVKNVQ